MYIYSNLYCRNTVFLAVDDQTSKYNRIYNSTGSNFYCMIAVDNAIYIFAVHIAVAKLHYKEL